MRVSLFLFFTIVLIGWVIPYGSVFAENAKLSPDQKKSVKSTLLKVRALSILQKDGLLTSKGRKLLEKRYERDLRSIFGYEIEAHTAYGILGSQGGRSESRLHKLSEQVENGSAFVTILTILIGILLFIAVGFFLTSILDASEIFVVFGLFAATIGIFYYAFGVTTNQQIYFAVTGFIFILGTCLAFQALMIRGEFTIHVFTFWAIVISIIWFILADKFNHPMLGLMTLFPVAFVITRFSHVPFVPWLSSSEIGSDESEFDSKMIGLGIIFLVCYLWVYLFGSEKTVYLYASSLLYLGGLAFYLTESYMSSLWVTSFKNHKAQYIAHQVVFVMVTIMLILVGVQLQINGFIGFAATFGTMYVLQKVVEVVKSVNRRGLSLILIGAVIWGGIYILEQSSFSILSQG